MELFVYLQMLDIDAVVLRRSVWALAEHSLVMDTPSRARPTTDLAAGGESPAAMATTKPPDRRLSADAVSSLSLEGSVSSSGSAGQPDGISGKQGSAAMEAFPSGLSDTSAAAALHHQTECEFGSSGADD